MQHRLLPACETHSAMVVGDSCVDCAVISGFVMTLPEGECFILVRRSPIPLWPTSSWALMHSSLHPEDLNTVVAPSAARSACLLKDCISPPSTVALALW